MFLHNPGTPVTIATKLGKLMTYYPGRKVLREDTPLVSPLVGLGNE